MRETACALVIDISLMELRFGQLEPGLGRVKLRKKLIHRLLGPLQLGLGFVDSRLVVARVENQQRLAALDLPVVFDKEPHHRTRDP